jgi:hypothetical protein
MTATAQSPTIRLMDALSPLHRAYYAYLSRMYALAHGLYRRSFLGIRLGALARWLPIVALLVGWGMAWPPGVMIALLLVTLWINYSLWRAKRDNYNRFVPNRAAGDNTPEPATLPPNERVSLLATGLFSVSGRESRLLLRPAQYWRVPLGDHIVMAEEEPGKFLYQFFDARSLQELREGLLLFGPRPRATLAVSFLARWGPEFTRFGQEHETGHDDLPPPRRVTVYLSAEDDATRRLVRDTIVSDARRARR